MATIRLQVYRGSLRFSSSIIGVSTVPQLLQLLRQLSVIRLSTVVYQDWRLSYNPNNPSLTLIIQLADIKSDNKSNYTINPNSIYLNNIYINYADNWGAAISGGTVINLTVSILVLW